MNVVRAHCQSLCAAKLMLLIPVTALTSDLHTRVSAHACQCMP